MSRLTLPALLPYLLLRSLLAGSASVSRASPVPQSSLGVAPVTHLPGTPASVVLSGAAFRHIRERISRRDAECVDLEDRFAMRNVDVDCLTAKT